MEPALILFVKNPIPGRVKTRLALETGDSEALTIYDELCEITRKEALQFQGKKYLYYSDFVDTSDKWSKLEFYKYVQTGSNLGERMYNALQSILKNHSACILIGSDCPYLKNSHFLECLKLLNTHDCVLGPAEDGGYYLIGIKKNVPDIFTGISWSSETVLQETTLKLDENNRSYSFLEMLGDIDYKADWEKFQQFRRGISQDL